MKKNSKIFDKYGYEISDYRAFKKALMRIRPSEKFGGIGVFAVRDIEKGTIVAKANLLGEDRYYSWENFSKIDKKSQEMIIDFCAQTEDGFFAPSDINYISIPWHMNHCCDGNIGCDKRGNFISIKTIKKNSELCYDYGLVTCNPRFKLTCKCGSKQCRGVVTGNDWMDLDYREKNHAHMSPEVKEFIKNKLKGK